MHPEIGLSEWLIIAVVALVVIGPKDLPRVLRTLGQWVAKMRGMASEFRASFDEMARQSELDDLRKEVEAMRQGQLMNPAKTVAEHAGAAELQQTFSDIEEGLKSEGGIGFPPMMSGNPSAALEAAQAAGDQPAAAEPVVSGPAEAPAPKKPRRASKTVIENKAVGGGKAGAAAPAARKTTTRKKA